MSRIRELIARLDAGDNPTQADLRRVAVLQALDVARAGEEFVAEAKQRQEEADAKLERYLARQELPLR